jgi:hypothetical protein
MTDTVSIIVDKTQALRAAARLVNESAWFAITPLPFDRYMVEVKRDRADALKAKR